MSKCTSKLHEAPFNPLPRKNLDKRGPTLRNPLMNIDISDYGEKPKYRYSQKCDKECKKKFYGKLFRSPDDYLWNRNASERQYVTNPVTTIPNDQTAFANWLYGNKYVGKSGSIYNRYGYKVTPDSAVSTGYNASVPHNGGQMENNNLGHPRYVSPYEDGRYTVSIPGVVHPPNLSSSFRK